MVMKTFRLRFAILILISVAILIFPLIVRAHTPINCGQTLAGTISALAEKDSYTFSGAANDGIIGEIATLPLVARNDNIRVLNTFVLVSSPKFIVKVTRSDLFRLRRPFCLTHELWLGGN
jgi:hypothetical protein